MGKKILITVVFITVFLILLEIFIAGPVGISPLAKGCAGIELSASDSLIKNMPDYDFEFKYPFNFNYQVNKEFSEQIYCLGKNSMGVGN